MVGPPRPSAMPRPPAPERTSGLDQLRRRGAVTELLFLYEVTTRDVPHLKGIAERLGVTVQAISHSYRTLRRRGLVDVQRGLYHPTVAGTAWLHTALGDLRRDVDEHLERLPVVRSARAVAATPVRAGEPVTLAIVDGMLTARAGGEGASHGRAASAARTGALVRVTDLAGIVPISPGHVRVLTIPSEALTAEATVAALRRFLRTTRPGLLAAHGGEAAHLTRSATERPVVRFGTAAAVREASALGVDATVVVLDEELPRFLEPFQGPNPPPLTVVRLAVPRGRRRRERP
jgi:putative transcriptional regulator